MSGSMSWLAPVLQGASSLFGAYTANRAGQQQANAANQAAQMQANTTNAQTNLLAQMYNQSRDDMAPYRAAGQAGLGGYMENLSQPFDQTPGYQFMQNEAMRGVMANAASRGLVNSGATLRALQDRAAGLADQTYGQHMNRLAAAAGLGQTAVGQGAAAGQNYAGTAANVMGQGTAASNNLLTQGAGALASGQNQAANALMGGVNNLLSYYAMGR